ncbi:MAG: trigger factor [Lachnospiraceae bacterium]|nr:trigger factor [Lachnospiraceae bacterium]
MSVSVEKHENSMATLKIEVPAEQFKNAIESVYQREKSRFNIPGFRKGKATRAMIEKMYGASIFYEEAANDVINATYGDAADESGEDITSSPIINVIQMEEGKDLIYTADVALKPPVSLGKYKNVEIDEIERQEVTEEDIDAEVDRERERNATFETVTDRAVEDGDMVDMDFDGSIDGVPFDGGKAEHYTLTIGSGAFIPGFEEQLVGKPIGEEIDVNVTFPEEYHAEELRGKAAVFKCLIHNIRSKKLPEADDNFAEDVSGLSTMKEYRDEIKERLTKQNEERTKQIKEDRTIAAIIADAKIDIPAPMLETQQRQLFEEFAQRMQIQGLSIDQYMQYTGQTREQMIASMKDDADRRTRTRLVLEEIAKVENITPTEEDFEEEVKKMAESYRADVENVKKLFEDEKDKARLMEDIAVQKAITFVAESAKEVKPKKKESKKEEKED